MGFPYTEVSPVLRSLQSSPVSVPLYNNLWLTSLSPCVFYSDLHRDLRSEPKPSAVIVPSFLVLSIGSIRSPTPQEKKSMGDAFEVCDHATWSGEGEMY